MIHNMLSIWSLVPLNFLNPACTSGSSQFMYGWSLAWRILSIILPAFEMNAIVQYFYHSLALSFIGIGKKTDLFQSRGHCWAIQICCHNECSAFRASSFRIWSSSAGIPSPPPPLFVVMFPMALESVMPSSHLILCYHLLILPPIPPSIRVFSNQSNSSHEVAKVLEFQL